MKGLNKLEKATWQASPDDMGMCQVKGQTEGDCHNFVKVLVSHRDRIFACGTHAFNPKCSWRNIQEIGRTIKAVDGRAKCPYSPHSNVTAMMTGVNGDYYISTPIDFSGNDPAIYRMAAGATKGMFKFLKYANKLIPKLYILIHIYKTTILIICFELFNRIWK